MSKEALAERVVNNPRIEVYGCGRRDIQTGQIDRRVLATLEFLAASGFKPTVTSLKCGHCAHDRVGQRVRALVGSAVDIAAVNGIPIIGHQGPGSITELTIQRLLTLQGTMKPRPDHLADEVRRHRQHVRDGRPRRPHPRRLAAAVRHQLEDRQAGQRDPQAASSGSSSSTGSARSTTRPCAARRRASRSTRRSPSARPTPTRASSRRQTAEPVTERRFGFVQWEFAGRLGPDPGRYPVRRFAGDDVREIVVIGGCEAPRRSLRPRSPPRQGGGGAGPGPGRGHARHGDRRRAAVRARRRRGMARGGRRRALRGGRGGRAGRAQPRRGGPPRGGGGSAARRTPTPPARS